MGNVVMESTQINYRRDEKLKTVDQKLQELSQESAIDTDIAPVFKSTDTYHAGDLVYYRNKLYVFNTDHTGAWAVGDVTATNVSGAMNAALAGKADYADIAGAFNAEMAYTAGDLVNYNGTIYRCTNDHTGDWDADDFSATTIGAEINAINSNISTLESGLNNKINASGAAVAIVIHDSSDGRYYSQDLSNYTFNNTRFSALMVIGSQDGTGQLLYGFFSNGKPSFDNSYVTYNENTNTITVDLKTAGWCKPLLLVPGEYATIVN